MASTMALRRFACRQSPMWRAPASFRGFAGVASTLERSLSPPTYQALSDHLDPASSSAEDFVSALESYATGHHGVNHHFLESLSIGAFGGETQQFAAHYLKAYGRSTRKYDSKFEQLLTEKADEMAKACSLKPREDSVYDAIAEPLVSAIDKCGSSPHTSIAANYFGSELILPTMCAQVSGEAPNVESAEGMRRKAIEAATSQGARSDMVEATRQVLDARAALIDNVVLDIQNNAEVLQSTGHGAVESGALYNAQSTNWVREKPTCLSDYTGRPVVFNFCEPHVKDAHVLDVGCGEGYVSRKMVSMGAAATVGMDISSGMVEAAKANGSAKESYLTGDATKLKEHIFKDPATLAHVPGADWNAGCFDLTLAIFVFNYTTITTMRDIMVQVRSVLKPGGHFVFSVPHPLMLNAHPAKGASKDATFVIDNGDARPDQYFSLRDREFSGVIKTTEGKPLNVKMQFKTMGDYFDSIKAAGFELVDVHEARVLREHVQENPAFFESVKDVPLHMVFKVRNPE